jgi:hypothetical protein
MVMGWTGCVACMERTGNAHGILVGKPEVKCHMEDLGIDGRIILR